MIPLVQCNTCTRGITFLAHPVKCVFGGRCTQTRLGLVALPGHLGRSEGLAAGEGHGRGGTKRRHGRDLDPEKNGSLMPMNLHIAR